MRMSTNNINSPRDYLSVLAYRSVVSNEADELPAEIRDSVPAFDDAYLDRVAGRLVYNYDIQADYQLRGEQWLLYAEMRVLNQKQFFHPALSYADHEAEEYLLARQSARPTVDELDRLVDLGHELADEWITADEEHYGTDITFVLIAEEIPPEVVDYVEGFRDRTLLKFGYYGHYDVNLVVVDPEGQQAIASEVADVVEAFTLWDDVTTPDEGLLSRFARRFWK